MRRFWLIPVMLIFAACAMGQDGCDTGGGGGGGKNGGFQFKDGGGGGGGGLGGGAGGGGGGLGGGSGGGGLGGGGGGGLEGGGATAGGCEPGYDPCVPTYPPDIDCADLGTGWREEAEGGIRVTGSDPHFLDADGDGRGCEL